MRVDYASVAPEGVRAVYGLQQYVSRQSNLDPKLVHLIELRCSQLNGCAFCCHLHSLQLRELGEADIRIDCLNTWEETDLFDERERAALAWAEAVNFIDDGHVADDLYEAARLEFSERELVDLTLVIATINVWNRLAISFRQDPARAPEVLDQAR